MNRRLPYLVSALFVLAGLVLQQCGTPPPTMPAPYTGSLRVLAMDTAYIKTISFDLDDTKYGAHPNPYLLDNVVIGSHKLHVYDDNNAGVFQMVEVSRDLRTDIAVSFVAEGPYAGSLAPKFTAKTIDDQPITLEGQRGKVVLLLFFEHT
jgi:hypothetical protein